MSSLSSSLVSVRAEDLADHQHAVGQLRFESTHVDLVRVVARIRLVRAGSSASKSSRGMPHMAREPTPLTFQYEDSLSNLHVVDVL